jgi:hypothetical protein
MKTIFLKHGLSKKGVESVQLSNDTNKSISNFRETTGISLKRRFLQAVIGRSYAMSQRSEEGGEKRIGEWIDSQVDWLQTWLFRYGY